MSSCVSKSKIHASVDSFGAVAVPPNKALSLRLSFDVRRLFGGIVLPSDLEISCDPSRIDVSLVHDFLSTSYWAQGCSRDTVERSIQNSLCFAAYSGGRQVAFARVITDRAVFAYLADVFVISDFRGRGIAKALMKAILDHTELRTLRRFMLATLDAHHLYEQFGFTPVRRPERLMERFSSRVIASA